MQGDLSAFGRGRGGSSRRKPSRSSCSSLLTVLAAILAERKVLARMQCVSARTGWVPRAAAVSPDGIKLALKGHRAGAGADKPVYLIAPLIAVVPAILAFAVIPAWARRCRFSGTPRPSAHRHAGGGTLRAGHHLGERVRHRPGRLGIRARLSAAGRITRVLRPVIIYEIAMALSFAAVFVTAGTMSTSGMPPSLGVVRRVAGTVLPRLHHGDGR